MTLSRGRRDGAKKATSAINITSGRVNSTRACGTPPRRYFTSRVSAAAAIESETAHEYCRQSESEWTLRLAAACRLLCSNAWLSLKWAQRTLPNREKLDVMEARSSGVHEWMYTSNFSRPPFARTTC
eukprot:6286019-Prymnesium_polylepis.1